MHKYLYHTALICCKLKKKELFMVTVRVFKVGMLDNLTTWGLAGSVGESFSKASLEYIQINIVITSDEISHVRSNTLSDGSLCFYASTPEAGANDVIKRILLDREIVGLAKLLTEREVDVLRTLSTTKSTKSGAEKLHISERTFANHRFNIAKKTGRPAIDIAHSIFDCSNVELFISMLTPVQSVSS
jgi:DNA-binding CsgD family transcriptional regulator